MSVTAKSGVAHTFVILARVPAFESGGLSFFSRKAMRDSRPPSRLDAALLCFQPRTTTCSRPLPRPPCRMFACESELLEMAFWIASMALFAACVRPAPLERPGSPRAFFPRFRAEPASIIRSPSRSTRAAAPRLRIPPRSEALERPREPFPFFILTEERGVFMEKMSQAVREEKMESRSRCYKVLRRQNERCAP